MTSEHERIARLKADALLSGLKVGRLPDGTHFPSDIAAVVAFGKWYAKDIIAQAEARGMERAAGIADGALTVSGAVRRIRTAAAKLRTAAAKLSTTAKENEG